MAFLVFSIHIFFLEDITLKLSVRHLVLIVTRTSQIGDLTGVSVKFKPYL